jgi:hypothetical protein
VTWRVPFSRGRSRAHRGLHGDPLAGGGDGLHPKGRSNAEDGSRATILFRDAKSPRPGRPYGLAFLAEGLAWRGDPARRWPHYRRGWK